MKRLVYSSKNIPYKGYVIQQQNSTFAVRNSDGRVLRHFDTEADAEEYIDEMIDTNSEDIMSADVLAAEESDNTLDTVLDTISDDFDYVIAGLEKLGRTGANATQQALAIAENLDNYIQDIIDQIADSISVEE